MPPLSEKAKGKRKAESLDPAYQPAPPQPSDLLKDSVRDIKKICGQRTEVANRRLRLIHSGRLLTDGTLLYPWLLSLDERQRRAHSEDHMASKEPSGQLNTFTWLHCSVGPVMEVGEDDERRATQATQIRPLRGFDRLQATGFSEEDIASIRRQFHSESSDNLPDTDIDGEDLDEHARALEEQWIDSIDTAGSAALSQSSASTSSTESRAPVFWDNGRQVERLPSVVFSKRMQMAIVIGFVLNITFGLWRFLLSS
ncbi:hypothetical protein JB92DRAFT_3135187 [Gautieria morchelliformis]|nr:hypothetical protein JB92DRAFT_3135187 [Gautieria morchelliformis]